MVGGGIVGCAIACELAGRGVSVVLLERDRIGAGASSAAAGMLAPQTEAQAADAWFHLLLTARGEHEPLACHLRQETGMDVGYRREGILRVALTEPERHELRDRAAWQRQLGLAVEWLEPAEARRLEPGLAPDIAGALYLPDEAQVHAPRLTQALALQAARLGVEIREGAPVHGVTTSFSRDTPRVTGLSTLSGDVSAGAVVLAAGAWSTFVCAQAPIEPVKGQMAAGALGPACAPRHIVWGPGAYLVPKADGQLLVGATEEPGNFDTRPTLGAIGGLAQAGARVLPGLANLPLTTAWAGLRPAAPDRRPLLGAAPDIAGLFLATGHFRNGILLGPFTGKLMARLILGDPVEPDLEPYSPRRFVGRRNSPEQHRHDT